jgi:hypothetical protein
MPQFFTHTCPLAAPVYDARPAGDVYIFQSAFPYNLLPAITIKNALLMAADK